MNLAKWNELPKGYRAILEAAATEAHTSMLAKYETQSPKALRELAANGTKLTPFTSAVLWLGVVEKTLDDFMARLSAGNKLRAPPAGKSRGKPRTCGAFLWPFGRGSTAFQHLNPVP